MPTKFNLIRFIKSLNTATLSADIQWKEANKSLTGFTVAIYGESSGLPEAKKWCPFEYIKIELKRNTELGKTFLEVSENSMLAGSKATGWSVAINNHIEHTELSCLLNELYDTIYIDTINSVFNGLIKEPVAHEG